MRPIPSPSFVVVTLVLAASATLVAGCEQPTLCIAGDTPAVLPTEAPTAHAHNDYEHARPLADALAARFGSVEADVWFRDGGIQVSHDAFGSKGTLEELYLAPLEALLADRASVHDDGAPFTLWLDLKDGGAGLREALVATLAARPWLTRFDDEGVTEVGAVTVILTGDAASKQAMVDTTPAPRPLARDSNDLARDDLRDANVIAAALGFAAYVGAWDGTGRAPDQLSRRCGCAVERAHAIGRKVRLFGAPDTPASWTFQIEHGVDFVNADDLAGLITVLDAR